jgi:transcriptional regulator with XRE-family HTH domain
MTTVPTERTGTLSSEVAEEIRAMMGRKRVSGARLAQMLGVSAAWISYRLSGTQPIDLNDLQRIARALEVPVGALLPRSIGRPNDSSSRLTERPDRTRPRGRSARERTRPVSPVPPTQRRPQPVKTNPTRVAA